MDQLLPINALGTQFFIEVWDEVDTTKLEAARGRLEFLLTEFNNDYSRFKSDSYIGKLNEEKNLINPPIKVIEVLTLGLTYYDVTQGILNMMIGEKIESIGYDADYSFTATDTQATIPNPHQALTITPEKITLHSGKIDIGGYGKGVAIDMLAKCLREEFSFQYFLINGGGDMYGTSENGEPITLYLEHPTESNTYIGTVRIMNQGFAASSTHKRTWIHNDTKYHHIIDTTNNASTTTNVKPDASFVIGNNATISDLFATVALLATGTQMNEFASQHQLGVATFTLPATLAYNQTFPLQPL